MGAGHIGIELALSSKSKSSRLRVGSCVKPLGAAKRKSMLPIPIYKTSSGLESVLVIGVTFRFGSTRLLKFLFISFVMLTLSL